MTQSRDREPTQAELEQFLQLCADEGLQVIIADSIEAAAAQITEAIKDAAAQLNSNTQ